MSDSPSASLSAVVNALQQGDACAAVQLSRQLVSRSLTLQVPPDPLQWTFFLLSLVCQGKLEEAMQFARAFPQLQHPELESIHWLVDVLAPLMDRELAPRPLDGSLLPSCERTANWLKSVTWHLFNCKQHCAAGLVDSFWGPSPAVEPALTPSGPSRLVGLVPARNESTAVIASLRLLSRFTDAIVFLDDCSDDDTVEKVKSIQQECRIERIICKPRWYRDEPGDRNQLLAVGREIGGTHFVITDVDEAFTANCATDHFLRRHILALKTGDQLSLNWIQLWRSLSHYRFDESIWTWNYKSVAFADDGQACYSSDFIHTLRVPGNLSGQKVFIKGYRHGLMHFQFVDRRGVLVKLNWYQCLERIRAPDKPVEEIMQRYDPAKDEQGLKLREVPEEWVSEYGPEANLALLAKHGRWREAQVLGWFQHYGFEFFHDLDIWDVAWGLG